MPVAWSKPRVDLCYGCLPGGPFAPPACARCGSTQNYFTGGLCRRCHLRAPQPVESCPDCHAWGVVRKHKWLCWGCKDWRKRLPVGVCRTCASTVPINVDQVCRLCWRQHVMCGGVKGSISLQDANRCGQQLFLANMHFAVASRGEVAQRRQAARASRTPSAKPPSLHAVRHRQLLLFDRERDLAAGRSSGFGPPTHPGMARFVDQVLIEHAARHGWGRTTIKAARQGIAIVLSLQDTPGAPMRATEILRLHQIGVPARRLLDVFAAAELLDDDRVPAIHAWVSEQITKLPEPMRTELHVWFDVMSNGSRIPPRHRPRSQITTRLYLSWALPALHA